VQRYRRGTNHRRHCYDVRLKATAPEVASNQGGKYGQAAPIDWRYGEHRKSALQLAAYPLPADGAECAAEGHTVHTLLRTPAMVPPPVSVDERAQQRKRGPLAVPPSRAEV